LAGAGITAPHDVLEGPFGYMALFDRGDLSPHIGSLGAAWRISEISVKPWPSGRASHGLLSVLEGRGEVGPGGSACAPACGPACRAAVGGRDDAGLCALCLPFLASLMMVDGHIDPRRFTPDNFGDARLRALGARLAIHTDGNPDLNALSPQRIEVDGESVSVPATLGSPAAPLTAGQQTAKETLALSLAVRPAHFDPLAMLTGKTA
jgi:2-methylcitrate dehydratase PrpD